MIGDFECGIRGGDCFGEDMDVCFLLNGVNIPRGDCETCGPLSGSSDMFSLVKLDELTCELELLTLEVASTVGVMIGGEST